MTGVLPELRDQARNRWPGILPQLGIDSRLLTGRKSPCPLCGGKDRFRFDNLEGNGTWICNNCGAGDGVRLLELKRGWTFKEAAAAVREIVGVVTPSSPGRKTNPSAAANMCRDLWRSGIPVAGTPAEIYLRSRGFVEPFPPVLRFCAEAPITGHLTRRTMPALLAVILNPNGKPVNLHRTYLEGGHKALIEEPRRTMPGCIPDGSAIRLAPAGEELGVSEGIETANAAARLFSVPVWAAINSTMLEKFVPPPGTRVLHVFGDNDKKFGGQAAAYRLAHRVACRDGAPDVQVHIPVDAGADWDDVRERRCR